MIFLNERQYKANLHAHSTLSDGRKTPAELKELYKSRGYSVLAITDHERPHDHTAMTDPDFLLLTGYEVYIRPDPDGRYNRFAPEVHLNLLAKDPHNTDLICPHRPYIKYVPADEFPLLHTCGPDTPRAYTTEYINRFIRIAKEDGYLVTYNHPVWSMEDPERILSYEGIFSMEMSNFTSQTVGLPEYNGALYDWLLVKGKRLYTHAADDNHNAHPLDGPRCDSFGGMTYLCTEDGELSYGGIIRALETGSFYASSGPQILSLETDEAGTQVTVRTSPASSVVLMTGSKTPVLALPETPGGCVTEAVFPIHPAAPYFRVHVNGKDGGYADSRGYFRDEWAPAAE
ncbi:MAG: hypothetical protein J5843_01990 [Clostridia bacterium]|nr:hypothetical protein [Clostridia bacterium]